MAEPATTTEPTTTTTTTTTAAPWYQGVDGEILGHWQNTGWIGKEPKDVAIEATKAYREAQKFIGAPPNEILRLPKADDAAAQAAFWARLGAPGKPEAYDFSGIKFADGSELDPTFASKFQTIAANLNLPTDKAQAVVKEFVAHLEAAEIDDTTQTQAKLAAEKTALAQNWGHNMDANMFVAKRAAAALGVTPEEVQALEGQIGYSRVMEMFRNIGSKIGEDKFVTSTAPGGSGVMTREQAIARKGELMRDADWIKRYINGGSGSREYNEMMGLNTLIAGDDTQTSMTMGRG